MIHMKRYSIERKKIHPKHKLKFVLINQRTHTKVYIYYMFKNKTGRKVFNPTDIYTSKTKLRFFFIKQRIIPNIYTYYMSKNNTGGNILNPTYKYTSKTELTFSFIKQCTQKKVNIYYIYPLRYIHI